MSGQGLRLIVILNFDITSKHIERHEYWKSHPVVHLIFIHFIVCKTHRLYLNKTCSKLNKDQVKYFFFNETFWNSYRKHFSSSNQLAFYLNMFDHFPYLHFIIITCGKGLTVLSCKSVNSFSESYFMYLIIVKQSFVQTMQCTFWNWNGLN